MSDQPQSPSQLMAELEALRQEVPILRRTKLAFETQNQLVKALISVSQASTGRLMLRSMLLETIKVTSSLVEAQDSSLFLIDEYGVVMESILARGATVREVKQNLIGQVLDKGLAGWVVQNHQIGLILDTRRDDRWLTLPNQPYTVGSALCVPIIHAKKLLGILTLTHPDFNKFNQEAADLMEMTATQMALALDNARLYMRSQSSSPVTSSQTSSIAAPDLTKLGVYILGMDGKFLYISSQIGEIFGYSIPEILELNSALSLVATDSRKEFSDEFQPCFQGETNQVNCKFHGKSKDGKLLRLEIAGNRTKFYGKFVIIGLMGEL